MEITTRDKEIIEYLEKFKVAKTSSLTNIFFPSIKASSKRLKTLFDNNILKRDKDIFSGEYYYYLKKSKQLKHDLLLTDFHGKLNQIEGIEIQKIKKHYEIENIIPDGFLIFKYNNEYYINFIEVELSCKGADIEKYIKLYEINKIKNIFPSFPRLIIITSKKVKDIEHLPFQIIVLRDDLCNILDILKTS